jgi:hypothetical protein
VTARSTQETTTNNSIITTREIAEMTTTAAATSTTIKITFEGEIRRIPIHHELTFEQFVEQTKTSYFPSLNEASIKLTYIDDEDDQVVVSSDLEFQEALTTMLSGSHPQRYPRFEVSILSSNNTNTHNQEEDSHPSSLCSECQSPLMNGDITFKCSARSNYEICQHCEENLNTRPPYPMVKFYPSSTQPRIVVTLQTNGAFPHPSSSSSSASHDQRKSSLHHGIRCNECGISPIVGIRYKCSGRHDYDLCMNCEQQKIQPFPMVKIYSSEHSHSGIHIFNSDIGTTAHSSSAATDEPIIRCEIDLDQGLEMLHHFLPHAPPHHHQFPPDHSNRHWRDRTREMFQRFCHSQETGDGNGIGCHRHTSTPANDGKEEDQQIDEEILNSVLKESLETTSSTGPPPTIPEPPNSNNAPPAPKAPPSPLSQEQDANIWSMELGLLRAMGFVNQEALVPLLKEHLGTPIDQGFPNPERMQTLIFSLLSNI